MDLLVQGRSLTEKSLKITENYLAAVISDLSDSSLLVVKPGIAFKKNKIVQLTRKNAIYLMFYCQYIKST